MKSTSQHGPARWNHVRHVFATAPSLFAPQICTRGAAKLVIWPGASANALFALDLLALELNGASADPARVSVDRGRTLIDFNVKAAVRRIKARRAGCSLAA